MNGPRGLLIARLGSGPHVSRLEKEAFDAVGLPFWIASRTDRSRFQPRRASRPSGFAEATAATGVPVTPSDCRFHECGDRPLPWAACPTTSR